MILIVFLAFGLFASEAGAITRIPTDQLDIKEGHRLYVANCIRCHNSNPHKPGVIGPELYTTPSNVFGTKVPYGTYPSGYVAKRRTKVMPKFPKLKDKTDLIYKYIQSVKK